MANLINGKEISEIIKKEIKSEILSLGENVPSLVVILVGNDPASEIYVKNKQLACEYVGIKSILHKLDCTTTEEELLNLIENLNNDKSVNGVLVQLPLPKHIDAKKVANKIDYKKDVDCFNPYNIGLLLEGNPLFKPCTPSGCIELLKRYNIDISGKICTVVGRSSIVGKPLINMLVQESATVICANSKTKDLKSLTLQSDIIVTAVGKANLLTEDMIKENCTIIDVGINRLENGKIVGDVCFEECEKKSKFITPVPGGVGPMTIAMLMKNCLMAYKIQNNI